jgi:23S rRNA (cytidine1920-2'-O)/16S rRNA (cytidine1409-2'-O)-methyltransferase
VDPAGKICLDCGASTGGFTDVLLQHGAKKVYAVDVGYGQLAWKLREDERVVSMERTNVRYITREQIPDEPALAVMDLSFISIRLVLPAVRELIAENGDIICLIKPQFEAGREEVGKKGVVRDPAVHLEVINGILSFAPANGLTPMGLDYSPIKGPEGNIEYLCWLRKGAAEAPALDPEIIVKASHDAL